MPRQIPYCVDPAFLESINVVRLKTDGPINTYRGSLAAPLLTGYRLILVSPAFADELKRVASHSASFMDVQVTQPATASIWPYVEIVPIAEIRPESISTVDVSGFMTWHYDRSSLFVSPAIKETIQSHAWSAALRFTPGFSEFA